jgi:RHS repeat-associated protein
MCIPLAPTEPSAPGIPSSPYCQINNSSAASGVSLASGLASSRIGSLTPDISTGVDAGIGQEWSSNQTVLDNQVFGNGRISTEMPTLRVDSRDAQGIRSVQFAFSGVDTRTFFRSATSPTTFLPSTQSSDSLSLEAGQYVYRTAAGDRIAFTDFSSPTAGARGQFVSRTDASGDSVTVTSRTSGGLPLRVDSFLAGQASPSQTWTYAYTASGGKDRVQSATLARADGTVVRTVSYGYFNGTGSGGNAGDLESQEVRDAAGNLVDAAYFRYYKAGQPDSTKGFSGALKYVFDATSLKRLAAAVPDYKTATDATIAPFAKDYYEYDASRRVTRHDIQGEGCSSCSGGIGTHLFAYTTNPANPAIGYNTWKFKTTQTLPDGTQSITYANYRGQTMLGVKRVVENGVTKQWGTFTRYDGASRPIWQASPEAVALPADLAEIEQYPDLMRLVSGNYQYLRDTTGLIEVTSYYGSTTATETVAGGVTSLVSATAFKRGDMGPSVTQNATKYIQRNAGGTTVNLPGSVTVYASAAQTTTYSYVFRTDSTQVASITKTLPIVSTAQNGPGTAVVTEQVFDTSGREIWSKDGDGILRYTAYDAQSGAVVKTIVDVNTSRTGDFQSLPGGWSTPAGGGLHLVTTYDVDRLGRPVKATDPQGNVTYMVYDDVNHSTRTYVGWNATTGTTTGPITVSRQDLSGTYSETLTYAATPAVDAQGRPTGTEAITNMQSLTRSQVNAAGQVTAVDRYTNLTGLAYSTASATLGSEGVNYLRTRYGYNNQGQVDRVQNPAGTITHSVYDGLSRLVGTWIGTDDSTTNGFKWTPFNGSPASNMVQIAANEYDNGNVGNGNPTKVTQFPGGGSAPRVTLNAYDWRNRLVATKTGASADPSTEDPSVNRPLTFIDYDNLGRVTGTSVYDGDGVWVVDANADGVPDKPAANLLRSSQVSFYDAQDRIYRTQELFVDQATGAVGTPRLTTSMFYDRRGNLAAVYAPNASVAQSSYDGANRLTTSYTLGNVPSATWANATSLTASLVLEQTEYAYDAASNVILTVNRQRFHDAATTLLGGLGTPASGILARVSYATSYYDAANRLTASVNVGTNGGVSYVRPGAAPVRSDAALVTTYAYDAAGRVQDVTDPRGIVARTLYDALSRTTATIANYTGGAASSQTDVTTLFTFDSAGRLASQTAVQPAGTPSQVTGYVYGISPTTGSTITSNDIMAETRYPDPVTGLPSATERDVYTTSALGERSRFTDRAGTTHTYEYDVTGRQTAEAITTLGTGVDGAVRRIESGYDVLGRVNSVTSFDASSAGTVTNQVTRAYNGFGQMTSEWQSHNGLVDAATTPQVQYAYSQGVGGNHSRPTRITYPDGYQVNYAYSGIDSAVSRATSLSGLRANAATAVTLEAFKYLGAATVIERARPEVNITLSMANFSGATGDAGDKYTGLDRFGRVVDQRWTKGTTATSPVMDRYGYTCDRNSNRLTRSNALAAAFSETYSYDALNQLQSFARTGGTTTSQQWQFDALGNWTNVTTNGVAQSRIANAQNELTQVGGSSLAYSSTGNLTADAQGRTLGYDAWNRLVSVKSASGTEVARYGYDGLNRRIVEQVGTLACPGAATAAIRDVYFSQDWQALEERVRTTPSQVAATADTRYIWSPVYVDAMVARDRNADNNPTTGTGGLEQRVYALQDANWNTTAIIAATGVPGVTAGNVINRFAYTPYGESQTLTASWATPLAGSTPAVPWSHLFQGLKFTDVTGLAYVRHRDYSATLGRFIEMDPIGYAAGDNNWYRFVANGPTGKIDPTGEIVWVPVIIGIGLGYWWTTNPANAPGPNDPVYPPDETGFVEGVVVGAGLGWRPGSAAAVRCGSPGQGVLTGAEKAAGDLARRLQFATTAGRHMGEAGRMVPRHTLADAILNGTRMADPQGAAGAIKVVQQIAVNGKPRTLEIIFREADNTILHFLYK